MKAVLARPRLRAGASSSIAIAFALAGFPALGCQEIRAVFGGGSASVDAGGPPAAPPPGPGRTIQGIPVLAGSEVAYAGPLETDYQIELTHRSASVPDAVRFYATALRQGGWQVGLPEPDGVAQILRASHGDRILTARFEPREVGGLSLRFVLLTTPRVPDTSQYAPIGDLATRDGGPAAAPADGGAAPAAPIGDVPTLPDGVPLPTGYRLASQSGLGLGSWEVVLEVDAAADPALARLTSEMGQMGWRFGSGGVRVPVAVPSVAGIVVGTRAGVNVTITTTESLRATGGVTTRLRLVGAASPDR